MRGQHTLKLAARVLMLKHQQSALPLLRSQPAPNHLRCKHPLPANNRSLHSRVSLRETCHPLMPTFRGAKGDSGQPPASTRPAAPCSYFCNDPAASTHSLTTPHSSDSAGDLHRSGTTWIKPSRKCNKNRCGLRKPLPINHLRQLKSACDGIRRRDHDH